MICGKAQRPGSVANSGLPGFDGIASTQGLRGRSIELRGAELSARRSVSDLVPVRSSIRCVFLQPCKRPFAKFWETQPIAGCCILVQQPLGALEGRCSIH